MSVRLVNVGESPVPTPRLVRAVAPDSATKLEPLPTMKLLSEGVSPATSESCAIQCVPIR